MGFDNGQEAVDVSYLPLEGHNPPEFSHALSIITSKQ